MSRLLKLAWICAAISVAACSPPRDERPDVIVIVLDTVRPDRFQSFDGASVATPALDARLARARCFTAAMSTCSWTAPALISLVTSLPTEAHGVLGAPDPGRLGEQVITLPEILRDKGWKTAAFTEGGYAKGQFGLDQGFEHFPAFADDDAHQHGITAHESRIRANVDRACAWWQARGPQPALLLFHTYQVHTPYRADEAFVQARIPGYSDAAETARAEHTARLWNESRSMSREDWLHLAMHRLRTAQTPRLEAPLELAAKWRAEGLGPAEVMLEPAVVARARQLYDACLAHTDRELSRLFETLDSNRKREQVVLIVSDHGEGLGEHRELEHGTSLYQSLTRIVLSLEAPGLAPGKETKPVSLLDAAPTILKLVGIESAPASFQGGDLRSPQVDRPLFAHGMTVSRQTDTRHAVRRGRWHLIHDTATQRTELFDLERDPFELEECGEQHPGIVRELLQALREEHARNRELARQVGPSSNGSGLDAGTLRELRGLGYIGSER